MSDEAVQMFWTHLSVRFHQSVCDLRLRGDEPQAAEIRFTPEGLIRYQSHLSDLSRLKSIEFVPISLPEDPAPPIGAKMFLTVRGKWWTVDCIVAP